MELKTVLMHTMLKEIDLPVKNMVRQGHTSEFLE